MPINSEIKNGIITVSNGSLVTILTGLTALKQAFIDHKTADEEWRTSVNIFLKESNYKQEKMDNKLDKLLSGYLHGIELSEDNKLNLDNHLLYHNANEYKWGILKLLKRKPFFVFILGIICTIILIKLGVEAGTILDKLIGIKFF